MTVAHRAIATGHLLELAGALDLDTVDGVRAAIARTDLGPGRQLVVDLAGVTFCDSSGLTALVAARNRAVAAEAGIALVAVPEDVARTLHLVGLDQVFPTHPTVDAAEAAFRP